MEMLWLQETYAPLPSDHGDGSQPGLLATASPPSPDSGEKTGTLLLLPLSSGCDPWRSAICNLAPSLWSELTKGETLEGGLGMAS